MTFSPNISIYFEDDSIRKSVEDYQTKAIWIFSNNLRYDKSLNRKRVNIHLGTEEREYIKTQNSIKSIWIKSKIDSSSQGTAVEKINQLLVLIYSALSNIGKAEGWDLKAIENAFNMSISDNGNFESYSKFKWNKERNNKARIKICIESDKVEIIANFFDSLDRKDEVKIIDTFSYEVDWFKMFDKPVWIDEYKFGFVFLDTELLLFADSISKTPGIIKAENKLSRNEIEGFLRRLTYKRFDSKAEMNSWFNG